MATADSMVPGTLLARVASAADCAAVVAGAGAGTPVRFCASAEEIVAGLQADDVAGVVLEIAAGGVRRELPMVVAALVGRPVPLLLRLTLRDNLAIRGVLDCHRRLHSLRLSLRELDALDQDVGGLLSEAWSGRARLPILSRISPIVPRPATRIVTAAAAAGDRAISVRELATLCQLSVRSLQTQLCGLGILPPKPLLQWMLVLHAIWKISRLGWSPQDVAAGAGLKSADVLSLRVARTTGMRLVELRRTMEFEELLERFALALAPPVRGPERVA